MALSAAKDRVLHYLKEIFSTDLRSLALARVLVGGLVLVDLLVRFQDVKAHYSDAGALSRSALLEGILTPWHFSLYMLNGTELYATLLLIAAMVCALMMMMGYRTGLATFLSWLLMLSVQNRNPLLSNAGEHILRQGLMFAMFLPWGARYSVDSAMDNRLQGEREENRYFSVAVIALYLQLAWVYLCAAITKTGPDWRVDHTAVSNAFQVDCYQTYMGRFLLQFPPLLKLITASTLVIEFWGPVLLFSPFWMQQLRIWIVFIFWLMHIGFAVCLNIGMFPFFCAAFLSVFLPGLFWEKLNKKTMQPLPTIYYDGDCGFCKKLVLLIRTFLILPDMAYRPAQDVPDYHQRMEVTNSWLFVYPDGTIYQGYEAFVKLLGHSPLWCWTLPFLSGQRMTEFGEVAYRWVADHRSQLSRLMSCLQERPLKSVQISTADSVVVVLLSGYIAWMGWHIYADELKDADSWNKYGQVRSLIGLNQRWSMFAPTVRPYDGWFVIPAKLENKKEINLFAPYAYHDFSTQESVVWEKPMHSPLYYNKFWQQLFDAVKSFRQEPNPKNPYERFYDSRALAIYLCNEWNMRHTRSEQIQSLSIYALNDERAPYQERKRKILEQKCPFSRRSVIRVPR